MIQSINAMIEAKLNPYDLLFVPGEKVKEIINQAVDRIHEERRKNAAYLDGDSSREAWRQVARQPM